MDILITLFITGISLALLLDYVIKKRRNDMTALLPGPKYYPIFGNAFDYYGKSPEDILHLILNNRKKYGPFYKVWIFNQLAIFSSDPKDVEVILSSQKYIKKNSLYDLLHDWLGGGLLLSTGSKWHIRRKIITPTFHFKILEKFVEIFDKQSFVLVEKLKPMAKEEDFDIHPYICHAALDIIAETAMGIQVNAQSDSNSEYAKDVAEITNIMAFRFVNVWYRFNWFFKLTYPSLKRKQDKAQENLHKFTENIIKKRRKVLEELLEKQNRINPNQDLNNYEDDDVGSKKKSALLDVLLQSTVDGKPLSNEDIREEVDTFMFEGHDTTTAAICFILQLISRHPEVQKKLFTELQEVFGDDKERLTTYRELKELKYLKCTIKEGLRMYPSVPLIGRKITEDINLNGKLVPAGTNYTIGIFAMLRDPELFPDPDKFNPDRHAIENTNEKTNPYSYIPFSAGPRNCIGQKFAMFEMKCVISKILRNYELLPLGPEAKTTLNLVLRSTNGFHLGLKHRM